MMVINSIRRTLLCFVPLYAALVSSVSIENFGAKEGQETWAVANINAMAFVKALEYINDETNTDDRLLLFPKDKTYFMYAINATGLHDVTIQIEGTLRFTDEIKRYPADISALMAFIDCEGVHFTGNGMIDGLGLNWWRLAYTGTDNRPNLIYFESTRDITVDHLYLYSSPRFSINFKDCADVVIHDVTIYINSTLVKEAQKFDPPSNRSVIYALNTDGFDLAVYNASIYNNIITNYDDAIVAKPCRSNWKYCQCAGNILAVNNTITYSTGLTIGSVPPNPSVNCIRNVTFRDSVMYRPLKALYIKPNPGENGTGVIENIVYDNIAIHTALWWTIWFGPQQQNQPGGEDTPTGCNFLFPFVPICPTQPLVTMNDITVHNVHAVNTVPLFRSPGTILCDAANPCMNMVFDDVTNEMYSGELTLEALQELYADVPYPHLIPSLEMMQGALKRQKGIADDDWSFEYVTSNVYGSVSAGSSPVPCFNDASCFWQA